MTEAAWEVPDPVATLDLCAVRAILTHDDGDPILVLHDTDVAIRLEPGSGEGGGWEQQSALGAERVASTLLAYAAEVRRRAGMSPSPDILPAVDVQARGVGSTFG